MSDNFISDLNDYFCKRYINFDRISSMPSYESVTISMVLKNRNRIEEGAYASNEVRKLAYQPNAAQVLSKLKERYVDDNFSFSVRVAPWKKRVAAFFGKSFTGHAVSAVVKKYGEDPSAMAERLGIGEKVWKNVLKGYYIPEKVLLFKLFLLLGMRQEDCNTLMKVCETYFNFEDARDVVVKYLLDYRVFNREMIDAAFDEFHLRRIL